MTAQLVFAEEGGRARDTQAETLKKGDGRQII